MPKIKLLAGLVALAMPLVVFAAPAMAEFESITGKSQGTIKSFPTRVIFETVEGGPSIICKSKNAEGVIVAEGGWQIQVKSTSQQGKLLYQNPTLKGPHEQLKMTKLGQCTGPTGLPAELLSCNLQVESNGTNSSGTASIYASICVISIGTGENKCTTSQQPDGNKSLQGVKLINNAAGVEIGAELKGITSTIQESKSLCKTLGVKGGQKTGKVIFEGILETEGQKVV